MRVKIWLITLATQFWLGLRRSLLTRRVLLLLVGLVLLLAMQGIILYNRSNPHYLDYFFISFHCWATLSILVPLAAMFLGVSALLEDTERGSIAYWLSRPAPRSALFLGRTLGAAAAALLFVLLVCRASTALVDGLGQGELLPAQGPALLRGAGLAAICFTAFGAFLGALTRKGLLWGAGVIMVGEVVVGSVIAHSQMTGFRSLLATDMARQLTLGPVLPGLSENHANRMAQQVPPAPEGVLAGDLVAGMVQYALVMLLLGVAIFCLREHPYKNRDS